MLPCLRIHNAFTRLQTFPHTCREHEACRMKEMIFPLLSTYVLEWMRSIRGNARREFWDKVIVRPLWIRWHWEVSLRQFNWNLSNTSQEGTGWTPKIRWSSQRKSITVKIAGAFEEPKGTMVTEALKVNQVQGMGEEFKPPWEWTYKEGVIVWMSASPQELKYLPSMWCYTEMDFQVIRSWTVQSSWMMLVLKEN